MERSTAFETANCSVSSSTLTVTGGGTRVTKITSEVAFTGHSVGSFRLRSNFRAVVAGPPCNRQLLSMGSTRGLCTIVNRRFGEVGNGDCAIVDPSSSFRGVFNEGTSGHHGLCGKALGYRLCVCFGWFSLRFGNVGGD